MARVPGVSKRSKLHALPTPTAAMARMLGTSKKSELHVLSMPTSAPAPAPTFAARPTCLLRVRSRRRTTSMGRETQRGRICQLRTLPTATATPTCHTLLTISRSTTQTKIRLIEVARGARGLQYTPEGVDVISLTAPCRNCRRHERVRCVGVTERMSCEACVLAQARNICGVGLWSRSLASQQEVSFTVCTLGSAYTNLVTIQTRTTSTTVND
jgi:hypothetical protein